VVQRLRRHLAHVVGPAEVTIPATLLHVVVVHLLDIPARGRGARSAGMAGIACKCAHRGIRDVIGRLGQRVLRRVGAAMARGARRSRHHSVIHGPRQESACSSNRMAVVALDSGDRNMRRARGKARTAGFVTSIALAYRGSVMRKVCSRRPIRRALVA